MTLTELGTILITVAIILMVLFAFAGGLVSANNEESIAIGALMGACFGTLVVAFLTLLVTGVGVGQATRTFNLVSLNQNTYYEKCAGNDGSEVVFCVEKEDEEIHITETDSIVSIETINRDTKPYAEIKSYADLQDIRKVVLYIPEDDCQTGAKKECAESGSYNAKSIQILLDAGYTVYFNGQLQGADFRIESLNLKNYLISHDADKKEVYIMDK